MLEKKAGLGVSRPLMQMLICDAQGPAVQPLALARPSLTRSVASRFLEPSFDNRALKAWNLPLLGAHDSLRMGSSE